MDTTERKVKQWIDSGKDPRSAHWQAGLEAMIDVFKPYLEPGKLIPVQALKNEDVPVFESIKGTADLSPNLLAAFLPPAIAEKITPPESAEELIRIDAPSSSYKILIIRPGEESRLMCAEISPQAKKPGADIFQSGALLGSYDYATFEDCISGLTQTIRAHMWHRGNWSMDEHRRYTIHWFERLMDLKNKSVQVEQNFSYLHSPTLIKSDKIDAMFTLIYDILNNRFNDQDGIFIDSLSAIRNMDDTNDRNKHFSEFVERGMLECLNIMRDFEIVKFTEFSDKENNQFKDGFSGTMNKIINKFNQ